MYVVSVATSQKGVTAARGRGGGRAEGWKIEGGKEWRRGEASVRDEHCLADSPPVFAGIIHALRLCSQTG